MYHTEVIVNGMKAVKMYKLPFTRKISTRYVMHKTVLLISLLSGNYANSYGENDPEKTDI